MSPLFRFLLAAAMSATICSGCAQGKYIRKGYAFSREILSGVAPSGTVDESGTVHKSPGRASVEYLVYAEVPASVAISVNNIWVDGKNYEAALEPVAHTPVVITNPMIKAVKVQDTLVKKTANKLWQVHVKQLRSSGAAFPANISKTDGRNQVVIEYLYKKRKSYFIIPAIKRLEPVGLQ